VEASLEQIFIAATKRSWEETLSRKPVLPEPTGLEDPVEPNQNDPA
jgi:hypothetical protein